MAFKRNDSLADVKILNIYRNEQKSRKWRFTEKINCISQLEKFGSPWGQRNWGIGIGYKEQKLCFSS